jgi:hypothetical protein
MTIIHYINDTIGLVCLILLAIIVIPLVVIAWVLYHVAWLLLCIYSRVFDPSLLDDVDQPPPGVGGF